MGGLSSLSGVVPAIQSTLAGLSVLMSTCVIPQLERQEDVELQILRCCREQLTDLFYGVGLDDGRLAGDSKCSGRQVPRKLGENICFMEPANEHLGRLEDVRGVRLCEAISFTIL